MALIAAGSAGGAADMMRTAPMSTDPFELQSQGHTIELIGRKAADKDVST